MPKFLVTGGAGFIGANLVKYLLENGHKVRVLDNFCAGRFADRIMPGAEYIEGDIRDGDTVNRSTRGVEGVFHLAAVPRVSYSVEHPRETHENNVNGTLNLLLAARDNKVKRFIFSSSSAAVGDQPMYPVPENALPLPISPYGVHKLIGEHYCRMFSKLYGLETVTLRYFNIYGSYMDPHGAYALVIGKFLWQKKQGQPLTICGDGEYYRDYTHVADVARANLLAMTVRTVGAGEVIEIGCGSPHSVNRVAELVGGEKTFIAPRAGDMRYTEADPRKANELLSWEPTVAIEEGIRRLKEEWQVN